MHRFTFGRNNIGTILVLSLCYWLPEIANAKTSDAIPDVVTFNAHIRPIMSRTCFVCHGPDEEDNQSELRLDSAESATGPLPSDDTLSAVVPGDPDASAIIARIYSDDDYDRMPPQEFRHQLTDRDRALFRKWVEQGAVYQQHWSYTPLIAPAIPPTNLNVPEDIVDTGHPVDAFVRARLAEAGVEPSPRANRRALLRRLSLDLVGLPPTPHELQEFEEDDSDNAYDKHVDRLLQSKHFGERMAVPWLDLVRFSDTVGFHGDQNQRIFPYRDYVIHAFNSNKPFDEFTREQLAGDLLDAPDEDQLTATGFLRLNMVTREGGAQPKEYLAKYTADRVRSIGTAWLGSTMGCCECHNHKYDPFATKDFYSMGAFFADLRQWGVYSDYGYTPNPDLRGFNNDYPFPPELRRRSPSLIDQLHWLQKESDRAIAAELGKGVDESDAFSNWVIATRRFLSTQLDGWLLGKVVQVASEKETDTHLESDGTFLLMGPPRKDDVVTVRVEFPDATIANAIRLEVLPDPRNQDRVGATKRAASRSMSPRPLRHVAEFHRRLAISNSHGRKRIGVDPPRFPTKRLPGISAHAGNRVPNGGNFPPTKLACHTRPFFISRNRRRLRPTTISC